MKSNAPYSSSIDPQVQQAQVALLFSHMPNIIISSMLAGILLLIVQWSMVEHTILLTWFTLLSISFGIRAYVYHQHQQQQPSAQKTAKWRAYFLYSTIPTFIIWGSAGVLMFPEGEPIYQAITILTLFGVSAGATNSLAILRHYVPIILPLVLAPICIVLLLEQQPASNWLAIMILIYAFFLFNVAYTLQKTHLENIVLRIQSTQREEETRLAEKKRRINEARLAEAETIAHMGSWEWDIASNKMYWSKETFRILGVNPNHTQATLETFLSHINPQQKEHIEQTFKKVCSNQQACDQTFQIEAQDGTQKTLRCIGKPILDTTGNMVRVMGMLHDISEQVALEEQLLHAQKMESVGILAGGIAHDFNNMLGSLLGQTYMAKKEVLGNTKLLTRLESIERISNRAAKMVQQLLVFARKDSQQQQKLNLVTFMRDTSALSEAAIPESISVNTDLTTDPIHIQADTTQLQQIILNLLNNAVHALQGQTNPEITIRLEQLNPDPLFQKQHALNGDPLAHLSISDNGIGMDSSTAQHIFEPFYTTKPVGEGTGLGLAMVYGAVQSHHGIITIDSTVNQGSTFHVYLPIHQSEDDILNHSSSLQNILPCVEHSKTILLVDDEETLRQSLAEALHSLGYRVLTADNGEQALEIYLRHTQTIALVISDIIMPKMDGHTAAQEMRKTTPSLPFIFMSGYDPQQFTKHKALENSILIKKPTRIDKLHQHIRHFLHTSSKKASQAPV